MSVYLLDRYGLTSEHTIAALKNMRRKAKLPTSRVVCCVRDLGLAMEELDRLQGVIDDLLNGQYPCESATSTQEKDAGSLSFSARSIQC